MAMALHDITYPYADQSNDIISPTSAKRVNISFNRYEVVKYIFISYIFQRSEEC